MDQQEALPSEFDYRKYLSLLKENTSTIIAITAVFILLTGAVTLISPRTYTSQSIVQIAEIYDALRGNTIHIYNSVELRNIVNSPTVLEPVRKKYSGQEEITLRELSKKITVSLIKEEVGYRQTQFASQVNITLKAEDPELARDMLEDVLKNLLNTANARVEELKRPYFIEYNETIRVAGIAYNESIQDINRQILEKNVIIQELNEDNADLEKQIKALEPDSLSAEALSKITLLQTLHRGIKDKLIDEKNNKFAIEEEIVLRKINYEIELKDAKINLGKVLSLITDFKVISEPSIDESPILLKLARNLFISAVIGLFFSCLIIILKEDIL